jgi:two-component system response regulator VanR
MLQLEEYIIMGGSMNILVVDDEREIADVVELYLKNDQYNVLKFYTGQDALNCINNTKIDLAILDIMIPDIDGFQILKQIREKYKFPVIMLTAKTEYMDKITGLTLGADDYIPKPFNPLELVARVKAQLRRYTQYNDGTKEEKDVIDFGGLFLDRTSRECVYNEKNLTLTPIEFEILWLLCENAGSVVSSEKIFETVWQEEYLDSNNTVMVHIRRIREKLKEPARNPKIIKTVWGVGYKVEK